MTTTNVTNLDDERLIREGEAAAKAYTGERNSALATLAGLLRANEAAIAQGIDQWVERMFRRAMYLRDAREFFSSDIAFGKWLLDEGINVGPNDRAALIAMAAEPEILRDVLIEQTDVLHADTIWRKSKDRFGKLPKAEAMGIASPNRTESNPPPSIEAKPVSETSANQDRRSKAPRSSAVPRRSALYGLPRADEVWAAYTESQSRSNIGAAVSARGGKEIWALILLALDQGFLTQTDISVGKVTARILFPKSPRSWWQRFNLTDARHRMLIRDKIMPAAIANRGAILAAPERIEEILTAHDQAQTTAARQAASERAVQQMPTNECQIVMFGQTLWPRLDDRQGTYDFDQIRAAVWSFRDLEAWNKMVTADNSVGSRAIRIRLSTKWYGEYLLRNGRDNPVRKVISLVHLISRLMEQAPEAECRWPPYPTAEAQW